MMTYKWPRGLGLLPTSSNNVFLQLLQFFLEDTKSSNGTFLNNQRLGKGTEDSAPREVFSGDTVQFGVDVTENSRRGELSKLEFLYI